jgi:hypothetical protein
VAPFSASWYQTRRNGDLIHIRMFPFVSREAAENTVTKMERTPSCRFVARDRVEDLNPNRGGRGVGHG